MVHSISMVYKDKLSVAQHNKLFVTRGKIKKFLEPWFKIRFPPQYFCVKIGGTFSLDWLLFCLVASKSSARFFSVTWNILLLLLATD